MADLTGTPVYQNHVRQLETTDPSHPGTWNPNYQALINNDVFLKARSDAAGLLGDGFMPVAGGVTFTYDAQNRISTAVYKNSAEETTATVTAVYDDDNGGRVNYIEAVFTAPVAATIRNTYVYDGNNQITGSTRTVS